MLKSRLASLVLRSEEPTSTDSDHKNYEAPINSIESSAPAFQPHVNRTPHAHPNDTHGSGTNYGLGILNE